MADEPYDALVFRTVDGAEHRMAVPAGEGYSTFREVGSADEWVKLDDFRMIQTDKIVSVEVVVDAHEKRPGAY